MNIYCGGGILGPLHLTFVLKYLCTTVHFTPLFAHGGLTEGLQGAERGTCSAWWSIIELIIDCSLFAKIGGPQAVGCPEITRTSTISPFGRVAIGMFQIWGRELSAIRPTTTILGYGLQGCHGGRDATVRTVVGLSSWWGKQSRGFSGLYVEQWFDVGCTSSTANHTAPPDQSCQSFERLLRVNTEIKGHYSHYPVAILRPLVLVSYHRYLEAFFAVFAADLRESSEFSM